MPEGAQGPGLFYTLKGIDTARTVDCREHVRLLDYQVALTKNALPLAVQPVLCYSFYSPIKACLDARDPEEMLKEFTESIIKKTIANHTAVEFINQKKKLQIFIRVRRKIITIITPNMAILTQIFLIEFFGIFKK